jgi:3-dehydrosphinganine reductase
MELRPYNVYVSVSYPPDTDTPGHTHTISISNKHVNDILGYEVEMQTKPLITKKLSESGAVFSPTEVAKNIAEYSSRGYFGISTGLDGWLLKNLHPGMSPVNNIWETASAIIFSPICRVISVFYLMHFDSVVRAEVLQQKESKKID